MTVGSLGVTLPGNFPEPTNPPGHVKANVKLWGKRKRGYFRGFMTNLCQKFRHEFQVINRLVGSHNTARTCA